MRIIKEKDLNIQDVVNVLGASGLVIYPTETVYGIGASAVDKKAIEKLT